MQANKRQEKKDRVGETAKLLRALTVQFSAPAWLLTTTVTPAPGDLTLSSGLLRHHVYMAYILTNTHINEIKICH